MLEGAGLHEVKEDGSMPAWEKKILEEQNFTEISFPNLKRKDGDKQEYYVFEGEDDGEPKLIEAATAIAVVENEEVKEPTKILQAHCRMGDVLIGNDLEYIDQQTIPIFNTEEPAQAQEDAPSGEEGKDVAKEVSEEPPVEGAASPEA